jgi:hypothetical protein
MLTAKNSLVLGADLSVAYTHTHTHMLRAEHRLRVFRTGTREGGSNMRLEETAQLGAL